MKWDKSEKELSLKLDKVIGTRDDLEYLLSKRISDKEIELLIFLNEKERESLERKIWVHGEKP